MKKKLFLLTVLGLFFTGCEKALEYDDISTITVASQKLEGLIFSCGINIKDKVYAIKKNEITTWSSFGHSINGFDYQEGNEYVIRIGTKNHYDPSMGDPSWDEYHLIEVISQTPKDSDGLPENFIPSWWEEKK
ncbi:MAG: DUF4377 domain-containing protein [Bacteroides sp.]|uniref:DUF4377 domain-containing protein n=1 Tax=Bacteroides sp. TaxID=29523 RepID=UPI002FC754D4